MLTSTEFFNVNNPALGRFALQSLYGADPYAGVVNPADVRTVRLDYRPTYFADEEQYMVKIFHDFGPVNLNITGGYTRNSVDSTVDYNLAVEAPLANNAGLANLNALGRAGSPFAFLNGVRQTLIPNGPAGGVCQSAADPNNVGVYGGNAIGCFRRASISTVRASRTANSPPKRTSTASSTACSTSCWAASTSTASARITTIRQRLRPGLCVGHPRRGLVGGDPGVGGNAFLSTPFYRNDSPRFRLKSYGIFGETYFEFSKRAKLTLGLRYNHDDKFVQARNLTLNV